MSVGVIWFILSRKKSKTVAGVSFSTNKAAFFGFPIPYSQLRFGDLGIAIRTLNSLRATHFYRIEKTQIFDTNEAATDRTP